MVIDCMTSLPNIKSKKVMIDVLQKIKLEKNHEPKAKTSGISRKPSTSPRIETNKIKKKTAQNKGKW